MIVDGNGDVSTGTLLCDPLASTAHQDVSHVTDKYVLIRVGIRTSRSTEEQVQRLCAVLTAVGFGP